MTNFGVQLFLSAFLEYALKPEPRASSLGDLEPTYPEFTGFVFKLQANMDPKHRDRVAFVRVCTGKFEKDMTVSHARTGKTVRLSRPQKLFAQGRESLEEAYAGDVIGLNNPGCLPLAIRSTAAKNWNMKVFLLFTGTICLSKKSQPLEV